MMFKTTFLLLLTLISFVVLICLYFRYTFDRNTDDSQIVTNDVIVATKIGYFIGSTLPYEDRQVLAFLGIPYALPPIGSLRFKRPVPTAANSSHVFEAKRWPNPCLQKDNHLQLNNYNFSEDCLYLNIWSPNTTTKHPVVVVIHTGAYLFGSASETVYNGHVFSALADVVVVTFNYRLNVYGFLFGDGVESNAGLYDQVLALQWISKNIDSFGGDPNRVTLLGQSTGAQSIGHHIMSPLSQHLFQRGVLFSGSPLQQTWLSDKKTAQQFWLKYAQEVNCSANERSLSKLSVECLSRLDRNKLPAMTDCKRYSVDPFVITVPVVLDNNFKVKRQTKSLRDKNISVLFGYTDDEGSWLLALDDHNKYGPKSVQNMSWNEAKDELKRLSRKIKSNTNQKLKVDEIANHYFDAIPENLRNDKNLMSRTIGTALGDFHISCPSHLFAQHLFTNTKGSQVYQYYWTYKGYGRTSSFWKTFEEVWCGQWMGSCHSFELYSVFGVPFQQRVAFNDMDRLISSKMIRMVASFAHYGKPMDGNYWMEFHRIENQITKPFHRIDFDLNFEQMFGNNLKTIECQSLWKPYIIE